MSVEKIDKVIQEYKIEDGKCRTKQMEKRKIHRKTLEMRKRAGKIEKESQLKN